MHPINQKVCAACKECGWNTGRTTHTTGACVVPGQKRHNLLHLLQTAMRAFMSSNDNNNNNKEKKKPAKKAGISSQEVATAIIEQCEGCVFIWY